MSLLDAFPCRLANFEGPLDYLLHLVQQGEIILADIPLHLLTQQFVEQRQLTEDPPFEIGAEFVGATATLMWLKSKMLLPHNPQSATAEEEASFEIRLETLQQLVEYCSLKKAAQHLVSCEEQQAPCYARGLLATEERERPLGLEIGLTELARLFQNALKRAEANRDVVHAEPWQVADALISLRDKLASVNCLPLDKLFMPPMCRKEVIVTFLAILELMKSGELLLQADGTCQRSSYV